MSAEENLQKFRAPWRVLRWPKKGDGVTVEATCDTKESALEIALDHANHELTDEFGNRDNIWNVVSDDWWERFNGRE